MSARRQDVPTAAANAVAGAAANTAANVAGSPAAEVTVEITFTAAMEELETILHRIESEETDIDRLAAELARAAALLELCRGKIRRAELEVSQIVQRLEEPAAEEGTS